jgi:ubiquitin carboxyl-terminal hydrolase L5
MHAPVSSPVYGVIFLFKYPVGEKPRESPKDGQFDHDAAQNFFFAAQTIQNACGTQALLSVLLNKESELDIGQPLREFKEFTAAFPPDVGAPSHTASRTPFGCDSADLETM